MIPTPVPTRLLDTESESISPTLDVNEIDQVYPDWPSGFPRTTVTALTAPRFCNAVATFSF